MKTTLIKILVVLFAILAMSSFNVFGLIDDDADGDGVPDSTDACPAEDASLFDRDGDGCLDDARGARHIEYWSTTDAVITYVINDLGAPGISDDSEITAIQAAINSWTNIADTGLDVQYGGTTAQQDGNGLDGINLVTFRDDTYKFGGSTLAVGLTTSFETDTVVEGRLYRAGEIFDADMLFNPNMIFRTGAGPGTDVQSVAAHEAGHLFGISHTAVRSSTMSYVLPKGTAARSLEPDDQLAYFKAYGSEAALAAANRIEGSVHNGQTNAPVPGAIVFITNAATGDSVGCDFTLPDGSFSFPGLADGNYHVQIFPLNGSSLISFMEPANVNSLVLSTAVTVFVPEFFDASESESDDPADKVSINLNGGDTEVASFLTNIDATGPEVVFVAPDGSNSIRIDAPFRLKFSEAVDVSTIQAAFSMKKAGNIGIGGNITIIRDDSVLVFSPRPNLEFSTSYTLAIDTDLEDLAGNPLASTFMLNVTTGPEPAVSINSLVPSKGVGGTVVVINGEGFENSPFTTVSFNGLFTDVVSIEPGRIVTHVPAGASTGHVIVTNPDLIASNPLTFTVLTQAEVARGYESGQVPLSGSPSAVAVTPNGGYAYVATTGGADAIVVDPALQGYLTKEPIPYAAGLVDIASSADGRRMYAVSAQADELVEIDSDPADGLVFNEILAARDVLAEPLGIVTEPAADRAFIATAEAEIQIWDVHLGSDTYRQQIGAMPSPGGLTLRGRMAITPAGDRLLGLTDSGEVLFYDLSGDTLVDQVSIGVDPRDIVVDPAGERAYVTHLNGDISVVSIGANPFFVQSIATSGTLRGAAISPGASYLYATDRELDRTKIIDLDQTHATFRSVVDAIPLATNPVDVTLSPDGFYAFSVLQGELVSDAHLVVTTVGVGPVIKSIYPTAGQEGTVVALTGQFPPGPLVVDFNGVTVNPASAPTATEVVVTVPAGFTSGSVRVIAVPPPGSSAVPASNAVFFEALAPPSGFNMRFGAELELPTGGVCNTFTDALAIRPQGDIVFAGCAGGDVLSYDIKPGSAGYHRMAHVPIDLFPTPIVDLAVTADGEVALATATTGKVVPFLANPNHPFFGKNGNMDISLSHTTGRPFRVVTSPNNRDMIVWEDSSDVLYLFDTSILLSQFNPPGSQSLVSLLAVDTLDTGFPVTDVAFHPTGKAAYYAGIVVGAIDLDPQSVNFRQFTMSRLLNTITYTMPMTAPISYSLQPSFDGSTLFVYVVDPVGAFSRHVLKMDVTTPAPFTTTFTGCWMGGTSFQWTIRPLLRMAPRGNIGIQTNEEFGFTFYDPNCPTEPFFTSAGLDDNTAALDYAFTPDGQRFYVASTFHDAVRMYDFSSARTLELASGNNQSGVISTTLSAPLRVRVMGAQFEGQPLQPVAGIPVTFQAGPGSGVFPADGGYLNPVVVSSDEQGFVEVQWRLGTAVGAQTVTVSAEGLLNSGFNFSATAAADPSTLPLTLAEVLPLNNTANTSITTAALVTFSRAVEVASISATSLFIESVPDATKVPVAYGFADGGRRVSMIPTTPLATNHQYHVVYEDEIVAAGGGGALTNPGQSSFTTQLPPPLRLSAISPPSSLRGVGIVISGSGFDPVFANNTVFFNDVPATPVSGDVNDLTVHVPQDAIAGEITVTRGASTSNALPFTVLVPNTSPIDDVISNVGTGSGAKSCAVTPDGALCYTVSTDGDVVIPIDINGLTSMDPIPVGDEPVGLVMHPDGNFVYVANFNSGSVSVIGTNPDSAATFNQVVTTIQVGVNPVDLAIGPSGELLYVVNAGSLPSENVSIVDVDDDHAETFNVVLSNVGTGAGAKSVAVSADGTRLFVGTDTGFVIIGADVEDGASYHQVISNVNTGSGSKSMAVSPDGTLLFIVTTNGSIIVVDVSPGSSNQVLSNVGTGSGAKSVAVSADGTLLYIVQENSSDVLVVAINVIPGVGAQNPDGASTFQVETSVVHTVKVGADPSDVAIDPSGSGVVIVTNTGDKTVSVLNGSNVPLGDVEAEISVTPSTLNLNSNGNYVTASIELEGFFVEEIVVSSVRLQQVIPPVPGSEEIQDADNDGIMELVLKFSRAAFQAILPQGEYVTVTVSGTVRTRTFSGDDVIRTLRPNVVKPHGGSNILPGATSSIQWSTPNGYGNKITAVDIHFSGDNGVAWTQIANKIPNSGSFNWTAPVNVYLPQCRVLITLWEKNEIFGQGMNQDVFSVAAPVAVRLKSFEVAVEDGDAVLRWQTNFESNMDGFQVVRADAEAGVYTNMTKDLVPAKGDEAGAGYEYRDASIRPNRTYWYKLVEVTPDGEGSQFGPYSVTFKLTNSLEQNMPNPFNPSTTIKYAIARDEIVSLVIYDVAGRQVRTLVDDRQRADVYKVTWDGINNSGQRVASGMYFYKLAAGKFIQTKKMMLLK